MKHVVAAIIVRDGSILICQRAPDQPMPLKWEFPGGKVELGEGPEEALRRELREELGIEANVGRQIERLVHVYKNGNELELIFYLVEGFTGAIENKIFSDIRWVEKTDLPAYDFLEADLRLVSDIANGHLL